jgi:hypothetical protein
VQRKHFIGLMLSTTLLAFAAANAADQAPAASGTPTQATPAPVDRDGKPIFGYELMTDQERGGYRSTLHFMKTLAERDEFRAQHRGAMLKRAKEKGVTLKE